MKKTPLSIVVQLVHISGPLPVKGKFLEFTEPEILIGRYKDCSLQFPPDTTNISRRHAEIKREGNRFKLIDYSKNGTYVNRKKIKNETYLTNGDILAFAEGGPVVAFRVSSPKNLEKDKNFSPPPQQSGEKALPEKKTEPKRPIPLKPSPVQKEKDEYSSRIEHNFRIVTQPFGQYGPSVKSFNKLPITIGKNPGSDFIIMRPSILDEHIQLFYIQKKYWIKDLTGQSLVMVNQTPIHTECALESDDKIGLTSEGPFFHYRFISDNNAILSEIKESFPQEKKELSTPKDSSPEDEDSDDKTRDLSFLSKIKGIWKD